MDSDEKFNHYLTEINQNFQGWDFSYINNRLVESVKPWSYHSIIIPYVLESKILLDMGTGGGEFLSKLPFPNDTFATECFQPNISLAKDRLEPLGIKVVALEEPNKLPFSNEKFDLIINRHEYYEESEVYRILQPNGLFITQQVGCDDCREINTLLNAPEPEDYDPNWTVGFLAERLILEGFQILVQNSCKYVTRIFDIGALIYFLKAIPWQILDFNIQEYKSKLYEIHKTIEKEGFIDITSQRYIIVANK